ncbi:MAG: pyrimidine reductase family protein [Nocardioidaceae bacterium]
MQALYPTSPAELTDEDIAELYAYPVERTWVRANFVSTLDGAVQGSDSRSGTLSTSADRRLFATLRSLCDVVLVGAGTARVEGYAPVRSGEVDAALRQRLGLTAVPAIAVVSANLDVSDELVRGGEARTLVVTTSNAPPDRLQELRTVTEVIVAGEDTVEPSLVVDELTARGYQRVLLEGGPRLMRSFVADGRTDDVCLTLRALLVGGDRYRMLRGAPVTPPHLALRHVLEEEGTLFCRYTRTGG